MENIFFKACFEYFWPILNLTAHWCRPVAAAYSQPIQHNLWKVSSRSNRVPGELLLSVAWWGQTPDFIELRWPLGENPELKRFTLQISSMKRKEWKDKLSGSSKLCEYFLLRMSIYTVYTCEKVRYIADGVIFLQNDKCLGQNRKNTRKEGRYWNAEEKGDFYGNKTLRKGLLMLGH